MKKQTKYLFLFVLLPLLSCCAIHLKDSTDYSRLWLAGGPVEFKVIVNSDLLVKSQTINVFVTVDEQTFLMEGLGIGEWRYVHNADSCISSIEYQFRAGGDLVVPFVPIPGYPQSAETAYEPESSYASLPITGRIGFSPDSISIYCNAGSESCNETVTIKNHKLGDETTIESINIVPSGNTGNGLHTGEGFSIRNRPTLPKTLQCGEMVEFTIRAWRTQGYTIQSGRLDINYTHNGTQLIESISLNANVFPPY